MFDNLSERLERSFKILKGEGKITEINVAETLKDVRKALLYVLFCWSIVHILYKKGIYVKI
jgi:signal recognition particle GTPase